MQIECVFLVEQFNLVNEGLPIATNSSVVTCFGNRKYLLHQMVTTTNLAAQLQ